MRVGYTHKQKQGNYYIYYCSNSLELLKEVMQNEIQNL